MRLDLCEKEFAAQASADDIARAIAQGPRNEDWSLLLEEDTRFLLAEPTSDGRAWRLQCSVDDKALKAGAVLDDKQLRALFTAFLNRDPQWRNLCRWAAITEEVAGEATRGGRRTGLPKFEAPAVYGVALLILMFITSMIPASWLPAALQDSGARVVILFVLAIPGALVAATIIKLREVRRAAGWSTTIGKITRCEVVVEKRTPQDQAQRTVNLPAVRYSYQAGGKRYTGDRISIGEIADNDPRIPEILERYKVGTEVPVYYQPDQPQNSVLERDAPVGLHIIWAIIAAILLVLGGLAAVLLFPEQIQRRLLPLLPDVQHPYLFLLLAFMAAMAALRTIRLTLRPERGDDWAMAPGTILVSSIETRGATHKTGYARLEYSYEVEGREYRGSRIDRNVETSGSGWLVRRQIANYPVGAAVSVQYLKSNPADAALVPVATASLRGGLTALLICGYLAWYFGTH